MVKIEAIIRPQRLEAVKAALDEIGNVHMTVTDVRGAGRQKGYTHNYRGTEYRATLIPKTKIEIVACEDEVKAIIDAIVEGGQTGEIGDGKIFIIPVLTAIQIRTGRWGDDVL